ncbi:MAG: SH3 domain-containing protein [Kiritimatiellia bacterium]|nr:SH3 domain-containing protein [Kiritimatiellia bacterium]
MKPTRLLILTALIGWAAFALRAEAQNRTLNVQVRSGPLRDNPSFLGRVLASADYGTGVEVLQTQGPWMQVRLGDLEGWMHQSALTAKRISLAAGAGDAKVAASADEVALAGKGFNKEVEAEYRKQNRDADFTWVDRMETMQIGEKEMREFLKDGRVLPAGGKEP